MMTPSMLASGEHRSFSTVEQYEAAIKSLEDETRIIEAQIQVHEHLGRKAVSASNATSIHDEHKVDELDRELCDTVNRLCNDSNDAQNHLSNSFTTTLAKADDSLALHDHYFTILDEELNTASSADEHDRVHLQKLLEVLQHTQSELIRTKLNRCYLEALSEAESNGSDLRSNGVNAAVEAKVNLVKHDLRTLQAEIDAVSQMVVMHEHGNQLNAVTSQLSHIDDQLKGQKEARAVEQISSMSDQLELICDRAEQIGSFRILQKRLEEAIDSAQTQIADTQPQISRPVSVATPQAEPALEELKEYLGYNKSRADSRKQEKKKQAAFENLQNQFAHILAVQKAQSVRFVGLGNTGSDVAASILSKHDAELDELEEEIRKLDTELEQHLSSTTR